MIKRAGENNIFKLYQRDKSMFFILEKINFHHALKKQISKIKLINVTYQDKFIAP